MQQDTKNKMLEILAAAKAKAANQSKNTFVEITPKKENTPTDSPKIEPSKLSLFHIIWQEGSGKYDGKTFSTWFTANKAMTEIYNEHSGVGYLKVKINVSWENGAEITDRADCSDSSGDFCPKRETIGEYLKRQNSVMYASTLNQGDRVNLSFEDTYLTGPELQAATISEFIASPNLINDIAQDQGPELSTMTIEDILQTDTQEPEQPKNALEIVDYSDKAFAVIGETRPIKETLKKLGGRFNNYLKCGPGWIFPKTKLQAVKAKLVL